MTVRMILKRIGLLSLGVMPVVPAVAVAAVATAAVASASELPAGVVSAINNGDYNEAQNALHYIRHSLQQEMKLPGYPLKEFHPKA